MGRFVSAVLMLLGALLLPGCFPATETFRYRLTVEVETPQGLRTGSSVIEVSLSENHSKFLVPAARGVNADFRGEAVTVDLPDGQVLFALLRSEGTVDGAKWYAHEAITTPDLEGHMWGVERARWMEENEASGELERGNYFPILVTFGDETDPTSVMQVDPDDLATTFGEGINLKRITAELTDDPVSTAIEERLGWLDNLAAYRTNPDNPFTNTLPTEVGALRSK